MTKSILVFTAGLFGSAVSIQAAEMKTGDERLTLREITQPSWTKSDQQLNDKVRTALNDDVSLREATKNIQLKTENNVVYIQGTAPSQKDKKAIEDKVRDHSGESELKNEIHVPEDPEANSG